MSSVNVFCFDFQQQAVRVGIEQFAFRPIVLLESVVEEIVHLDFAVFEDRRSDVDRSVQNQFAFPLVDRGQVV